MTRYLVFFLIAASLADACLTHLGLRLDFIEEANPLMRFVYEQSLVLFYVIKLGLPLALFYLMLRVQRTFIRRMLIVPVLLYAFVLGLHTLWVSQLVQTQL